MSRHNGFYGLFVKRMVHDRHYHGQMLLLALVSLLISFSLVFVSSMSNGIARKYAVLGGGSIQVSGEIAHDAPYKGDVVRMAGALCYGDETALSVAVKGVDDSYFSDERVSEFQSFSKGEGGSTLPPLLLSSSLAKKLGLKSGDKTLVVFVKDESYKPVLCVVDGIYASGYEELDDGLLFAQEKLLERYGYEANTELLLDSADVERACAELRAEGYDATAWYERNDDIATNLVTSNQVVFGVFAVIVLLASFFVSDFSSTLVSDKKREIALLKLLGLRNGNLVSSFLLASSLLSFCSITVGLFCGILFSYAVKPLLSLLAKKSIPALSYYLLSFSITIPFVRLIALLAIFLILSSVSALISLSQMRKVDPILLAS
jgi:lipoprotein-releasing system permease protein